MRARQDRWRRRCRSRPRRPRRAGQRRRSEDKPQELGIGADPKREAATRRRKPKALQQMGTPELLQAGRVPRRRKPVRRPSSSRTSGSSSRRPRWCCSGTTGSSSAEPFELLKLLISSVMPLGILTIVVLAVILFGITTATESAAIGAAGAFLLALPGADAQLGARQAVGVPDREDDGDGVLAVRRLGAVLGRVRDPRRPAAGRARGCCRST